MMKKTFILCLLMALVFTVSAHAATKARSASAGKGIGEIAGIADLSSGDTMEVDANGSARVKEATKSTVVYNSDQNDAFSGATVIYSVTLSGGATTAADAVILSDAATVPTSYTSLDDVKIEVTIGTTGDTEQVIIPGGVLFSTGVSIDVTDSGVYATIVYSDY